MSISVLMDSGANISCITENALGKSQLRHLQLQPSDIQNIVSVSGDFTPVKAIFTIPITINKLILPCKFYVFKTLHRDVILGLDFMETHNVDILLSQKMVIRDGLSEAALTLAPETANINTARIGRKIYIPAMSETIIPLYLSRTVKPESTLLLEPHTTLTNRTGVIGARCVAIVNNRIVSY